MTREEIDQFGYYRKQETVGLAVIFLRRSAVASNVDREWSVRFFPNEEQWNKIFDILGVKETE